MAKNPWEDCDQLRLPFYRPFDVAIRWCGLADQADRIAAALAEPWHVQKGEWAEVYPCLAKHSESVAYAMQCGLLRYGRDGRDVGTNEQVAKSRRTVTHAHLKDWLRTNYPADVQKPHMAWLFDDVERSLHDAITIEVYQSVVAERDA
ncbi:MAG: hypothetical protein JSS03_09575 [Proteobacteria bacterium]|nr:hypothetical protein [Pseudomonadota bacterium]